MQEVAAPGSLELTESGKAPTVEGVGPEEELLATERDGAGARRSVLDGGVPSSPVLGLFEEEALEAEEGGDLEVVGAVGGSDPGEEGGCPNERSLRVMSADEAGASEGQGGTDGADPAAERLRCLELPVAGRAVGRRWGEVGR